MISVTEAKDLIQANTQLLQATTLPLQKASGCLLAEDLYAPINIPAFRQSSMDGYAFAFGDWNHNKTLRIDGEIAAGQGDLQTLKPGTAIRIFTGAPVPPGADTVVMQEKCRVTGSDLSIEDTGLALGGNVRAIGTDIGAGELAVGKGSLLNAAATGFLAGMGITEVTVVPLPRIHIIVTGNELQSPGLPLQSGQVYESNSWAINAALHEAGLPPAEVLKVRDEAALFTTALKECLTRSDLVLITGGISVGDYDFTLEACQQAGVETLFHRVNQRPGKPLFFGKKGATLVFGLPGNPGSVLTCFYEYVRQALFYLCGRPALLQKQRIALQGPYKKPAGITHFLKAQYLNGALQILEGQESYKLNSFAKANCLAEIPATTTSLDAGEFVEIHLL